MAPNRYTVTNKYYDEKKGSSGAYWPKKHTSQRREVTLSTIDSIFHVKYEKLRYAKLYLHGSMAIGKCGMHTITKPLVHSNTTYINAFVKLSKIN